jgi:hypothetical protein
MSQKDDKEQPKPKNINRRQFITRSATAAGAVALTSVLGACGSGSSSTSATTQSASTQSLTASAWKFGVMSDTQWTYPPGDDNYNPNTAAVGIANQIQQQLINSGVNFVVHVGDLCDNANLSSSSSPANSNAVAGEDTRALYAQSLYNAGIGFFPLRGNHDDAQSPLATGAAIAKEFARIYPQTQTGQHNTTPSDILGSFASNDQWVPVDAKNNPYATKTGSAFTVGSNFSSPDPWGDGGLKGLSYSFDFNNVRCILLDQFVPSTGNANYLMEGTIGGSPLTNGNTGQQSWISAQLAARAAGSHAFVFAHKGLLTCNHADNLFSPASGANATPAYNPNAQNAFFKSLKSNNVAYYFNGHDHMNDRSIVTSPDGSSSVIQILAASNSSKFYPPQGSGTNTTTIPIGKSVDTFYNSTPRRQVVSQELYTIGYYIVTVNGPVVNVDYYAADVFPYYSSGSEMLVSTAQGLNFTKRESFGYSLNGKQFIVAQGKPYNVVQDSSSGGTAAKILGGVNGSKAQDACGLAYVKVVNTGWSSATSSTMSDILWLWGINPLLENSSVDVYALSLGSATALNASYVICTQDAYGNWTNAVNLNSGGTKNFVIGAWNSSYGLGTFGIDPSTNTAWAVLNYTGVFAIAKGQ